MNPSPLRYPGGKYKLHKYILELIKLNNSTTYIEPFCGGAALALELLFEGAVKKVIINDYDYTIYCFWDSILHKTNEFIKKMLEAEVSLEEWHRQKAVRDKLDNYSSLEIGFSTFFLNRTNRSGIIDKAGPIGGMYQTGNYEIDCRFNKERLIQQIEKIALYNKYIKIYNMEALDFIDDVILNTKNSFTFFDPPYYSKGPELYTNFYSHGDHMNLSKHILVKMKNRKWIVTYDNINAIKNMYIKADSFKFELQYSLQNKKAGSEVMFLAKNVRRPSDEASYIKII